MSLTSAPLFSESASGSIADVLTFVNARGKTHARISRLPTENLTWSRRRARGIIRDLAKIWSGMGQGLKNTWTAEADENEPSGYQHFLKLNIDWLKQNVGPADYFPYNPFNNSPAVVLFQASKSFRQITFTWTFAPLILQPWFIIYRAANILDAIYQNQIYMGRSTPASLTVDDLPNGVHTFRIRSVNGAWTQSPASLAAVVTLP